MTIQNSKILHFTFSFCILIFAFCIFSKADAAILYLEPPTGQYHQNDIFLVEVRLDAQGEYINAAEVNLDFPEDILEFKDFSKGNSILSIWPKEPKIENGAVSFTGGIPGGYQGTGGLLGKMVFQVRDFVRSNLSGRFDLLFSNSKVLLNDGKGTEAKLNTKGAVFSILTGAGESKNEWQEEIEKDKILPEPFKIELSKDSNIFEGKYFIVFSTVDKQTGIDHYEIKEGSGKWQITSSPYVLKNQKLTSDIKVKAIDRADNFWMETLEAPNKAEKEWENYLILGLSLVALVLIFAITKIIRKKEKKII